MLMEEACTFSTEKQTNSKITAHRSIMSIKEDGHGKIWAGAEDGLYYYNNAQTASHCS
jgi:ligand-binding sensor domain-containing protein